MADIKAADINMVEGRDYTVKRDSNAMERMWYLYHRHGLQSNLIVAASYAKDGKRLTKPCVLEALRVTVETHSALRTVCVQTPSKRKGKTGLSYAILHSVDLESCVEFRDDVESGYAEEILEGLHNEWEFLEANRPWFKLVVVGQADVYFVYHHAVSDGMSGYIFHRTFLEALNAQTEEPSARSWISKVNPADVKVEPKIQVPIKLGLETGKPWAPAFFETIWPIIVAFFLELVFPRRFTFAELPYSKKAITPVKGQATPANRIKARLTVNRIPNGTTKRMLAKCRENGTTLTCLWQTALLIAITSDLYPRASLIGNRVATDIRTRLPEDLYREERNVMGNRSGGLTNIARASRYRKASRKTTDKNGEEMEHLDVEEAWELARSYKKWIVSSHDASLRTMNTEGPQGVDLDDFVKDVFPMVGTMARQTVLLSNLGPLAPHNDARKDRGRGWTFTDALFSAAPTNGYEGSRAPIFSLGGVKGGDLLMVTAWQDGIASQELAESMFRGTMARIEAMIE